MIRPNIYSHVSKDSSFYDRVERSLKIFSRLHPDQLIFCLSAPLGIDTTYTYDGVLILSPSHKIIFIGNNNDDAFSEFVEDVFDDLSSLSKKYNYQKYIGRPREWKDRITNKIVVEEGDELNFEEYIGEDTKIASSKDIRLVKYLISLFTGSINRLDDRALEDEGNLLDEIRRRIVLFDADQTRFLYNSYAIKTFISVQGLSGTGKTELLLHKLREIYSQNESETENKIFFTCHNIALSHEIKARIPDFFNKMKVSRQIVWNKALWVAHAWGGRRNPNSGLYSYICDTYNLPFIQYRHGVTYDIIYSEIKKGLDNIPPKKFAPCFDYILIDENQDFPEVFFEVCKKITRKKVYTSGDVFQNIFYQSQKRPKGVDISLNRCYRTDPRTLMFAHTLGLGLKEDIRYNWFERNEWELFGYKVSYTRNNTMSLQRLPINRFDGQEPEESVVIECGTSLKSVCDILHKLKEDYPNIKPGDVAIIMIDDDKDIYGYMDGLSLKIQREIGWNVLRGHEDKHTDENMLYLTNTNNVKGLEFPFVICITSKIINEAFYRNKLYTMLTRSFLITYLLIKDGSNVEMLRNIYSDISKNRAICDIKIPDTEEKDRIRHALVSQNESKIESWEDFMSKIFAEMGIQDQGLIKKLKELILFMNFDKFDEEKIRKCIKANIEMM